MTETEAIWVKSEPTLDGKTYVVTLEASNDEAVTLTPERALQYAWGVLAAAHTAAYDAAVLDQMHAKLGLDLQTAGQLVNDLRQDRAATYDDGATAPLVLVPGVSAFTREPFISIEMPRGKAVGQWTVGDARGHAMHVLEAVVVADLDAAYYRALRGHVGLDEGRARQVVADIENHRSLA